MKRCDAVTPFPTLIPWPKFILRKEYRTPSQSVILSQALHHSYPLCLKNLDGGTKGTRYNNDNVWHLPGILLLGGGEYVVWRSMRPPSPWGVDHGVRPN